MAAKSSYVLSFIAIIAVISLLVIGFLLYYGSLNNQTQQPVQTVVVSEQPVNTPGFGQPLGVYDQLQANSIGYYASVPASIQ